MLDSFLFTKHLEEDEHVRMIVHKHWLLGLGSLAWPSVSFLLSWFVLSVRPSQPVLIVVAVWSTMSLVWWFRNFLDYYLDAWIITDHGIIDLEWLGWFHRQSSRILYSDIQGVSNEVHGIAGTLLRFGSVTIEKISTGSAISIENVPRPRAVESVILKNMETYLHSKNLKNAKHIEELLSKFVAEHIQEGSMSRESPPEKKVDVRAAPHRATKNSFRSSKIGSPKS